MLISSELYCYTPARERSLFLGGGGGVTSFLKIVRNQRPFRFRTYFLPHFKYRRTGSEGAGGGQKKSDVGWQSLSTHVHDFRICHDPLRL